jgi:hypothetical protein
VENTGRNLCNVILSAWNHQDDIIQLQVVSSKSIVAVIHLWCDLPTELVFCHWQGGKLLKYILDANCNSLVACSLYPSF